MANPFVSTPSAPSPAPIRSGPVPGVPSRFELCLDEVLLKEGGFVNDPRDPGGATNMGITLRTLAAWRHADVTAEEVEKLGHDEACDIYRANYWNVMRCDDLPRGVDLFVFDFGVNAGPATSVKLLQKVAGAESDGSIGPLTLRAVASSDSRTLIEALTTARLDHYRNLAGYPTFGKGWEKPLHGDPQQGARDVRGIGSIDTRCRVKACRCPRPTCRAPPSGHKRSKTRRRPSRRSG